MKYTLLLILMIFLFFSCKKDKPEAENRIVETFSSTHFKRYYDNYTAESFFMDEGGSLVIAGNGIFQQLFNRQPFILKLDLQKEVSWLKFLNVDQHSIHRKVNVIQTLDEKYMVLCNAAPDNFDNFNIDLTKVKQGGQVDWNKRIGQVGKNVRHSASIIQLPGEDFIIFSRVEDLDSGKPQLMLNRVSMEGDTIWAKIFDDNEVYYAKEMILFPESSSFIALSEHQIDGFRPGEIKIRKFDFDGNTIWQRSIFAPGPVWPLSCQISRIENENFMILFSAATSSSNNNDHDITLVKMDQHGNEIWKKTYNWKGSDISKKLIQTADGKYTMVSSASGFGNGGFDVMLSKIDINGEIIWEKVFGGANSDQGANLLERSNGNLVILGNTNEGNTSDAIFDFFVLETDSLGNPE